LCRFLTIGITSARLYFALHNRPDFRLMSDFAAARRHMIDGQLRPSRVTAPALLDAMAEIPREEFVLPAERGIAYHDEDLRVGQGRFLMEPLVLARLIQAAAPLPQDTVLDIGMATGYSSAVLSRLAAQVVALDDDSGLADRARATLTRLGCSNVTVATGPLAEGFIRRAPYGVILINGAIDEVPPALQAQLGEGGRLAAVVGTGSIGRATIFTRVGRTARLASSYTQPLQSPDTPQCTDRSVRFSPGRR
jgi:protein-L-isoaspartate(D-aspartate) O-methyltransferase